MNDGPIRYDRIPVPYMEAGLRLYFERGVMPGSFLSAVLNGDLFEAALFADPENRRALYAWADWFVNHAPRGSFGSPDNVANWVRSRNNAEIAAARRREMAARNGARPDSGG